MIIRTLEQIRAEDRLKEADRTNARVPDLDPKAPIPQPPTGHGKPRLKDLYCNPDLRKQLDAYLEESLSLGAPPAGGREVGGWIFYDASTGGLTIEIYVGKGRTRVDRGNPPPGTIAGFHTHPGEGADAPFASPEDVQLAVNNSMPEIIVSRPRKRGETQPRTRFTAIQPHGSSSGNGSPGNPWAEEYPDGYESDVWNPPQPPRTQEWTPTTPARSCRGGEGAGRCRQETGKDWCSSSW
jgi:hypothetical protein